MAMALDRGAFIKSGFSCSRGMNGGWTVISTGSGFTAHFTSFAEMCDWLEDQHEGLVIGEMGRNTANEASLRSGVDAFLKEQKVEPPFARGEEDPDA